MNEDLHEHLLEAYTGPSNASVWPGWLDDSIRVDISSDRDAPALICPISVTVSSTEPGTFQLELARSPQCPEIIELVIRYAGQNQKNKGHLIGKVTLRLTTRDVTKLRSLAKAYRRAVGRGARYLDRHWKWQCPRIAQSLDQFASHLTTFTRLHKSQGGNVAEVGSRVLPDNRSTTRKHRFRDDQ